MKVSDSKGSGLKKKEKALDNVLAQVPCKCLTIFLDPRQMPSFTKVKIYNS